MFLLWMQTDCNEKASRGKEHGLQIITVESLGTCCTGWINRLSEVEQESLEALFLC